MTESPGGERGSAENELLPTHIRSKLRHSIELICAEERNSDAPQLERDRNLGGLLRQVVGRHNVQGYPEGPMPRSAIAHVERMIGVYLVEFGLESKVVDGEMEMRNSLLQQQIDRIDRARLKASDFAENGWQSLDPLWQAAYEDTLELFAGEFEV